MQKVIEQIPRDKIVELDVRPMLAAGKEPLGPILGAIEKVPVGGALRLTAPFEPVPLYSLLGEKGWKAETEWTDGNDFILIFYKDAPAHKSGCCGL